jgi:hypothetical protein
MGVRIPSSLRHPHPVVSPFGVTVIGFLLEPVRTGRPFLGGIGRIERLLLTFCTSGLDLSTDEHYMSICGVRTVRGGHFPYPVLAWEVIDV